MCASFKTIAKTKIQELKHNQSDIHLHTLLFSVSHCWEGRQCRVRGCGSMWRNQTKVLDDGGEGGCKGCDVLLVLCLVYASYGNVCNSKIHLAVFEIALLFFSNRVPRKINYLFLFLKSVLKFSTKKYSHGVHANTIPSTPPSCTGLIIQPLFTPPSPQPIILHAFINIVKYQFTPSGLPPLRDNWSLLWILTLTVSASSL